MSEEADRRRLAETMAALESQGFPTDLADLPQYYPPPFDGENAAAAYAEAFASLPE